MRKIQKYKSINNIFKKLTKDEIKELNYFFLQSYQKNNNHPFQKMKRYEDDCNICEYINFYYLLLSIIIIWILFIVYVIPHL